MRPFRQLHFLFHLLRKNAGLSVLAFVFVLISTALDHVAPWILKLVLDHLLEGGDFTGLLPYLYSLLSVLIVAAILLFWQRFLVIRASRKVEYDLRNRLFYKLQQQPRTFFDNNPIGDIMSRMTNDLDHVRDLLGPAMLHSARMILMLIYTTTMLWILSPLLAAVGLALSLLLPLISMRFMRFIYGNYKLNQESLSRINVFVQETFSAIQIVKSFGREDRFQERFDETSRDFQKIGKKVAYSTGAIWPTISLISGLGICLAVYTGSRLVLAGEISIGDMSAALLYLVKVQFPLVGLGWVFSMIQRGRASLERIMILDEKMEENLAQAPKNETFEKFQLLECKNLSYRFPKMQRETLSAIDLRLVRGQHLGIVGETGSGKTTLVHLLTGLYRADSGMVYINGKDCSSLSSPSVLSYFSLAPQDGFLFSESIRSNVELGSSDRGPSIENAVTQACLDIDEFPHGLESLLGEKGINLSGGQRQRVGLARALASGAEILILDDTLSAVDSETEYEILARLKGPLSHLTAIIVSHRYSAVKECGEIINLEKGKIIERGTHEELMHMEGSYARNYRSQILSEGLEKL